MAVKLLQIIFMFAVYKVSNTLSINDMLRFGSTYTGSATERTVNVHNMFNNATLLDAYAQLIVPSSFSNLMVLGANLGKNIYINLNGHLTFGSSFKDFSPEQLNTTGRDIIAVYYSDNDLRRSNGLLHYRFTTDSTDLSTANILIRREGFSSFSAQYCIVATWENVKYYIRTAADRANPNFQQENTYQVVVCTDGTQGHTIFHYNKLQWSRSQDTSTKQARAGWYLPTSTSDQYRYFPLPNTGTADIVRLTDASNIRQPQVNGRWMLSLPRVGVCATKADGVYASNCTSYYICCSRNVERIGFCPSGTVYHPFTGYCVESRLYPCGTGAVNFCDGRTDGRYTNTGTVALNDFYECKSQLTRELTCPPGITFNTGNPRCSP